MSRIESDFLGELEIPDEAYYGVQTMRGKHNFNITEMPMSQEPFFAIAYGYQKFDQTVTWTAVIIMIVLVQVVQGIANAIAKRLLKRQQ